MKRYALYGAGVYGRAAYHALSSDGEQVSCFVDGDSSKWGTEIYGTPVISLSDWQERRDGSVLILTCSVKNQREIELELKNRGITEYRIFNRLMLYARPRLISYSNHQELED